MIKELKCLVFIIILSIGSLSAQTKPVKQLDVFISTQMAMQVVGNSNVAFKMPANQNNLLVEKADAIQIKVQTNRNWVLHVKPLSGDPVSLSNKSQIPATALRIRTNGGSFTNLNRNGIDLIKGNKGSYESSGNSISIDYELPFKRDQNASNYEVILLFTLAAI